MVKCLTLPSFVSKVGFGQWLTLACVVFIAYFVGIMGDFAWSPLVKQVGPTSGTVPASTTTPAVGLGGQPTGEVSPIVFIAEVTPNSNLSILAKRKRNDSAELFGRKKSKALISLRALRQAVGLMLDVSFPSAMQDVPLAVEASTTTTTTPTPSPPVAIAIQEVTLAAAEVTVLATLADSVVAPSTTIATPLVSVGVTTISATSFLYGSGGFYLFYFGSDGITFFILSPSHLS